MTRLPGGDRQGVALIVRTVAGHLEVVPADAAALLGDGRLDPRLFDVTGLHGRAGEPAPGDPAPGDPAPGDLGLIIQGGDAAAMRAAAGPVQVRELASLDAFAVRVPTGRLPRMWAAVRDGSFRKVWLDGVAEPSIDVSVPLVGAPAAWAAGWTGAGVGAGVLDTGVDSATRT